MDAHIQTLLLNVNRPEKLYALRYILEYNEVPVVDLVTTMECLYSKQPIKGYTKETVIELEWRLQIIMNILEQLCRHEYNFTSQFLDEIRNAISIYKKTNKKITQLGEGIWKDNCAEFNELDDNNNEYLLEI